MAGLGLYVRNTIADALRSNRLVQSAAACALWTRAWLARRNPTRRLDLLARAPARGGEELTPGPRLPALKRGIGLPLLELGHDDLLDQAR